MNQYEYENKTKTTTNTVAVSYESLAESVRRVRELHTRLERANYCGGCGEIHPCRTRVALDGWSAMKEQEEKE